MAGKQNSYIAKGAKERPNLFKGLSNLKKDIPEGLLVFNFKFFDVQQGQTFSDWEKEGLLSQAFDVFRQYSSQKMSSAFSDRFKTYKGFPEQAKTEYTHPKHVPEDALWASMHLQGRPCVIGHVHGNIFYVVFLDRDHRFYITELKNT